MRNTKLPILNVSSAPPARKQSSGNLDALFSAICLFLDLHPVAIYTQDLVAILSSMHNLLIPRLDHDASELIKLYKELSIYFLTYVRGVKLNFDDTNMNIYDWDEQTNLPRVLVDLIPFLDSLSSTGAVAKTNLWQFYQAIYCFLSGHRVIVTPMAPSYSSITNPSTVTTVPSYVSDIPAALKALGITPDDFQRFYKAETSAAKLSIVNTAGPNGQATWSAFEDAQAILANQTLMTCLTQFADESNLQWIITSLVSTAQAPKELSDVKSPEYITGRLHPIEEWGGKTRVVAIFDYWTQAMLTPLHNTIFNFLRLLPTDGTFDQLAIIEKVREWTSQVGTLTYSYDLTAATDRIPISFQRDILAYLLGSESLADLWVNIMRDRDFTTPEGDVIRYAVGQPMGAKSSFGMLALCHHVIVQIAAKQAAADKFLDYVVLGDDNTMASTAVSNKYLTIMASLGVPINTYKSVIPGSGLKDAAEICKRIFIEGKELTSLPAKLIVKCSKYGYMLPGLQNVLYERGRPVADAHLFEFFSGIADPKSVTGIILLNKVPTEVSGLKYTVSTPSEFDYGRWHKGLIITDEVIKQAFIYALVTEQLKRVDSLLRGTIQMNEIVVTLSITKDITSLAPAFFLGMTDEQKVAKAKLLPKLSPSHPISFAAHDEVNRVVSYLSGLRSGSPEMVSAARRGLLDMLRNSLHEIWLSEDQRAGMVQRSVFNVMLSTLARVAKLSSDRQDPTLNFSILLTSVGRMWSVTWKFGDNVHINVVKSRVESSSIGAKNKLSQAVKNVDFNILRL